jgi:hypothetical protein
MISNIVNIDKVMLMETHQISQDKELVDRAILTVSIESGCLFFKELIKRILIKKVDGDYILENSGFLFYFEGFSEKYKTTIEHCNLNGKIERSEINVIQKNKLQTISLKSSLHMFSSKNKEYNEFELTDKIKEDYGIKDEINESILYDLKNDLGKSSLDFKVNLKERKYFVEKCATQLNVEDLTNILNLKNSFIVYSAFGKLQNVKDMDFLEKILTPHQLKELHWYSQENYVELEIKKNRIRIVSVFRNVNVINKMIRFGITDLDIEEEFKRYKELKELILMENHIQKINNF